MSKSVSISSTEKNLREVTEENQNSRRFFSKRKAGIQNLQYPKNAIWLGLPVQFGIDPNSIGPLLGVEVGYSHLFKNQFELGISYSIRFNFFPFERIMPIQPNDSLSEFDSYWNESPSPELVNMMVGHRITTRFIYILNHSGVTRFNIGFNGFVEVNQNKSEKSESVTYSGRNQIGLHTYQHGVGAGTRNYKYVRGGHLYGGTFEFGVNFGNKSFNVNPYAEIGVAAFSARVGYSSLIDEYTVKFASPIVGVGARFRFLVGKKN